MKTKILCIAMLSAFMTACGGGSGSSENSGSSGSSASSIDFVGTWESTIKRNDGTTTKLYTFVGADKKGSAYTYESDAKCYIKAPSVTDFSRYPVNGGKFTVGGLESEMTINSKDSFTFTTTNGSQVNKETYTRSDLKESSINECFVAAP